MDQTHNHHNHNHSHDMTNSGEYLIIGWLLFCLGIGINHISISLIQKLFVMISPPLSIPPWSFDWMFIEHAMSVMKFCMTMLTMSASLFFTYRSYKKSNKK